MFKGKAVLVIDRLEACNSKDFRWDIHVNQLTINQDDPGGEVAEMFSCMDYDCIPAPAAAYNMAIGDRIRVLVSYEIHFSTDYWGEHDAQMYLLREKVLRYQRYKYRKYPPKPYKLLNR